MKSLSHILLIAICICHTALFAAAEAKADEKQVEKKWAISVQPLFPIFSSYFANVEYLFASRHSFFFEAGYIGSYKMSVGIWSSSSDAKKASWRTVRGHTLTLQYRYHFSDGLDSGFIGPFVKYGFLSGNILSADTDPNLISINLTSQPEIGFAATYGVLGVNVGRRWVWDSGVTMAVRIGVGANFPVYKYSLDGYEFEKKIFADAFGIFLAFDVEFSIGYAF